MHASNRWAWAWVFVSVLSAVCCSVSVCACAVCAVVLCSVLLWCRLLVHAFAVFNVLYIFCRLAFASGLFLLIDLLSFRGNGVGGAILGCSAHVTASPCQPFQGTTGRQSCEGSSCQRSQKIRGQSAPASESEASRQAPPRTPAARQRRSEPAPRWLTCKMTCKILHVVHLGRLKPPRKAAGQMDMLTIPSHDGTDMRSRQDM